MLLDSISTCTSKRNAYPKLYKELSVPVINDNNSTVRVYTDRKYIPIARLTDCKQVDIPRVYRIAGNFGEVFNLANWRVCGKSPNLKPAKYCDIALYVCDRYRSSPNLKLANMF